MLKYSIKNEYYGGKTVGYLYYDEDNREYEIEVPETVESFEAPMIISDFDEFTLLLKNNGRSCQDECYIEKVEETFIL